MYNHACASIEGAQLKFSDLMSKMHVKSNGDKDVAFDDQFSNLEDLTAKNEWVLNSLARKISCDDACLYSNVRREIDSLTPAKYGSIWAIRLDILQVIALMEVLFPVKFATFSTKSDLMKTMGSDRFAFTSYFSDKIKLLMQPVTLTVTIVPSTHVHKIAVNTKSGTGTFVKGKDEIYNWILATASQDYNPEEGSVQALIIN